MEAQTTTVAGEYYLRGVMETASGFKLEEDGSFQFFFSYGALDRSGEGTWKLENDSIVFQSPKPKSQGFTLLSSKSTGSDSISIKIIEQNAFFLPHVYAIIKSGEKQVGALSDSKGLISLPKQPFDSILLLFEFSPEKTAVFTLDSNKNDDHFEFKFDPSILDVVFEKFSLRLDDEGLSGQHPLLREGEYHFVKH